MMRKLTEEDRQQLLEYVSKEPEMNLFFIGDIENYGIDTEEVSIYVQEEEPGWDCVLLRFFDFYIIYSQKEVYGAAGVADFLKGRTVDCISGKTGLVKQMAPFYPKMTVQETIMCRCDESSLRQGEAADAEIRRLTGADVPEMMRLYLGIAEFAPSYRDPVKSRDQLESELEKGELAVGMFKNGRLVSLAKTSASNSMSTMLVGVATEPDERRKGYASVVVGELCRRAFEGNREFICLFYDNPEAGRIYRKTGFREIGSYSMMR